MLYKVLECHGKHQKGPGNQLRCSVQTLYCTLGQVPRTLAEKNIWDCLCETDGLLNQLCHSTGAMNVVILLVYLTALFDVLWVPL